MDGGQPHLACCVNGRGEKDVGRHKVHGMKSNVGLTIKAYQTYRVDPTCPDINAFFADKVCGHSGSTRTPTSLMSGKSRERHLVAVWRTMTLI